MTFAEAMRRVLNGEPVRRNDWNRPHCIYKGAAMIGRDAVPGIWMEMKDGRVGAYTPSQCDMLADDWGELETPSMMSDRSDRP